MWTEKLTRLGVGKVSADMTMRVIFGGKSSCNEHFEDMVSSAPEPKASFDPR